MNKRLISYILGWVLLVEGASMQLSTAVGLIYREWHFMKYFFYVGVALIILGVLLVFKKPKNNVMHLKDGFAATALSWILLSVAGCLPLWWSRVIPHFVDAVFETVSGFTTTGATILREIEHLPRCMLFWRSFSHFLGGMGVVVFLLAIIPRLGGTQNINLMKAESTGPSVSKSMPKLRNYAALLYGIYGGLTVVECVLLLCGGMNIFDAVTTSFSTAGTGGFMVYNDSMARFSPYLQTVVAVFMMLFGVNFNAYYLILTGKLKEALKMEEVRGYFIMIGAACALIMINMAGTADSAADFVRNTFFQVSSLETSTGYATVDFDLWPDFSKAVLIFVMFIGACAGSTGGGIKVSRLIILIKSMLREIGYYLHPKSVRSIKSDGKTVDEATVSSINAYLVTFLSIFCVSMFLVSLEGRDLMTNFSAVLTAFNNMGPGFADVGPTKNFSQMSVLSKYVLMFDMLAGRLEIYPMLMIFHPVLWKETFEKRGMRKRHSR